MIITHKDLDALLVPALEAIIARGDPGTAAGKLLQNLHTLARGFLEDGGGAIDVDRMPDDLSPSALLTFADAQAPIVVLPPRPFPHVEDSPKPAHVAGPKPAAPVLATPKPHPHAEKPHHKGKGR